MAIVQNSGLQWPLYAVQRVTQANLANVDGEYDAIVLPAGAMIISGSLVVSTAWDDGTAATLSVGIKGGAANAYLAATSIQAIAVTAFTGGTLVPLTASQTVTVTAAFTDSDATVGEAYLVLAYVVNTRATEVG